MFTKELEGSKMFVNKSTSAGSESNVSHNVHNAAIAITMNRTSNYYLRRKTFRTLLSRFIYDFELWNWKSVIIDVMTDANSLTNKLRWWRPSALHHSTTPTYWFNIEKSANKPIWFSQKTRWQDVVNIAKYETNIYEFPSTRGWRWSQSQKQINASLIINTLFH